MMLSMRLRSSAPAPSPMSDTRMERWSSQTILQFIALAGVPDDLVKTVVLHGPEGVIELQPVVAELILCQEQLLGGGVVFQGVPEGRVIDLEPLANLIRDQVIAGVLQGLLKVNERLIEVGRVEEVVLQGLDDRGLAHPGPGGPGVQGSHADAATGSVVERLHEIWIGIGYRVVLLAEPVDDR